MSCDTFHIDYHCSTHAQCLPIRTRTRPRERDPAITNPHASHQAKDDAGALAIAQSELPACRTGWQPALLIMIRHAADRCLSIEVPAYYSGAVGRACTRVWALERVWTRCFRVRRGTLCLLSAAGLEATPRARRNVRATRMDIVIGTRSVGFRRVICRYEWCCLRLRGFSLSRCLRVTEYRVITLQNTRWLTATSPIISPDCSMIKCRRKHAMLYCTIGQQYRSQSRRIRVVKSNSQAAFVARLASTVSYDVNM